MLAEELDSLGNGHVQNVVDVLSLELYVEDFTLETLSVTFFTFQHEIGHELHFHRDDSRTLAFFASAALGVEREILRCIAHLFG